MYIVQIYIEYFFTKINVSFMKKERMVTRVVKSTDPLTWHIALRFQTHHTDNIWFTIT